MSFPSLIPTKPTPIERCLAAMCREDVTIERLLAMDVGLTAAFYGLPEDWAKWAREEAIRAKGGDPNVLLRREK